MKRRACDAEERGGFGKDVRKENVTEVNGLLAVHGGAEKLFSFQRRGGQKGLRKEASQVEDRLSLNLRDLLRYRERSVAPLHEEEEVTNILSRKTMLSWLSRLQMGFNLLIQGVGDPKPLMQRFAALLVNKEDVFELDCAASNRPIASLLDVIVRELLKKDPATIRAKSLSLVDYTEEVTRLINLHYRRSDVITNPSIRLFDLSDDLNGPATLALMNKVNERSDEEEEEREEDKMEKKEDNDEEEALMKAESVVVEKDTLASPNAQKSAASPSPSSLFSRFTSLLPALPSQLLVRALSPFASSLPSSPSLPQLMTAQEEEEPSRRTPRRRRHRSFAPCNGNGSASSSTYRGRYEYTQGTLYLFVHEIEALDSSSSSNSSYEAESVAVEALCLSLLAACPSISLVASASHLNVGLTWDSNMLKRFNWIFPCSASSFQPFEVNEHSLRGVVGTGKGAAGGSGATTSSFSSSSTQPVSDAAGANGVDYILQSLSMSHRELLSILCREHFRLKEEAKKTKTKSNEGKNKRQKTASSSSSCISFQEVYTICCNRMVVKNQADFSKLLKELTEQRIVTIADRSSGGNNNSDHRSRGGADGGGKIISLLLAEDIILQQVEGFHSLI